MKGMLFYNIEGIVQTTTYNNMVCESKSSKALVAYTLAITDVDPIRYGLLFERFLSPDRVSMPD